MTQPVEDSSEVELDRTVLKSRPDPAFRYITSRIADRLGVKLIEAKLPQTLLADFILNVPEDVSVQETLFDFFRTFNVIEFKGQDDQFDELEFVKNEVRTGLVFLQNSDTTFENMLNLIVSSRYPQRFFDFMQARGLNFKPDSGRNWLQRCRVGLQEVVVVVCNLLPLEEKYADWLLFAAADTKHWREAMRLLAQKRNWELLEQAERLRPKEFAQMKTEFDEVLSQYDAKEQARLRADWLEAFKITLPDMLKRTPEDVDEVLASLSPEQLQMLQQLIAKRVQKPEQSN